MKKRKWLLIVFSFLLVLPAAASNSTNLITTFRNFHWKEHPKIQQLDSAELKQSFVVLKDDIGYEYFYDNQGNVVMYKFKHKIIRLNDDAAIEQFNKVFVYLGNSDNSVALKARSIQPDGTVINVADSSIKTVDNYQNMGAFDIFAINGLEKGSEVEYYYLVKDAPTYYGSIRFQNDNFIKEKSFTILSPTNLLFKAKGYNGLAQPRDTIYNHIFHLELKATNIPAFEKETYSAEGADAMRLDFKFAGNTASNSQFNYNWDDAGKRFYTVVYVATKDAFKETEKLLNKAGISKIKDKKEQVFALENYIKDNFDLVGNDQPGNNKITDVIKNKTASYLGITRFYAAAFAVLKIKNELVLVADRNKIRIDPKFPNWAALQDYLFYLPKLKIYLQPTSIAFRHGLIDPAYRANNALYISPDYMSVLLTGNMKNANLADYPAPEVKPIPESDYNNNDNILKLKIHINNTFTQLSVNYFISYSGYEASFIKPVYSQLSPEHQSDVINSLIQADAPDAQIISKKVFNYNVDSSSIEKPFTIESKFTTDKFINFANQDRIFQVGMLIGKQMEMYNDSNRINPIMIDHTHEYQRTITFNIPKGYKVEGLGKLNINITENTDSDAAPDLGFISNYSMPNDSTVTVKIHEFYSNVYYPIKDYAVFRKVINASADFNKISLLFVKE